MTAPLIERLRVLIAEAPETPSEAGAVVPLEHLVALLAVAEAADIWMDREYDEGTAGLCRAIRALREVKP